MMPTDGLLVVFKKLVMLVPLIVVCIGALPCNVNVIIDESANGVVGELKEGLITSQCGWGYYYVLFLSFMLPLIMS